MDLLEATRAAIALAMLTGALVMDFRSRRVPNRYWFPFIVAAAALWLVQVGRDGLAPLQVPFLAAVVVAGVCFGLFYLGLYGGADAKGLMVMAFLVPALVGDVLRLPPTLVATLLGTLLSLGYPLILLALNLARGSLRFPAMLVGIEMDREAARRRHVWPMQTLREDGTVAFRYWRYIGRDFDATYDALAAAGITKVWVTPKIPFLAFVWAGYLLVLALGNPMEAFVDLLRV